MSVRNCGELGINLQKIVNRLLANDELIKLLYYNDLDPLSNEKLTTEQKNKEIFNSYIKIVPRETASEEDKSFIALLVPRGQKIKANQEYQNITIEIEVFTPLTNWIIKDSNLRPFAIIGEIEKSLDNKTINGLGKIRSDGFSLRRLTDDYSMYAITLEITEYD